MARMQYRVTAAELAVMQVLWARDQATIRQLADALYPRGGVSEYYTVQKLLERLEEKGCVARNRAERIHTFRATIRREHLLGERLQELSDTLAEGSLVPLLTSLVRMRRRITSEEYRSLKELVAELDRKTAVRPRRAGVQERSPT